MSDFKGKTQEFVLGESVEALLAGSYERLSQNVAKAVQEDRERLFGSKDGIRFLGTFRDHALVMSESTGQTWKVRYETSERGEIVPILAEVGLADGMTVDKAATTEAAAFVDAFLNGSRSLADGHFRRLSAYLPALQFKTTPERFVESFERHAAVPRAWVSVYEQKRSEIEKTISLSENSETRVPKFRMLYEGQIPKQEHPAYEGLVTSDLKYLQAKFEELLAQTQAAFERMDGAVPAFKQEEKDPSVALFRAFAEDYLRDLTWAKNAIAEGSNSSNPIDVRGKIYDVLASQLHRYEVAGRFIENMSCRLDKAATKEG